MREFNRTRNWERYHNPKDVAVSLSIECAELLEPFQWKEAAPDDVLSDPALLESVKTESADILVYLICLANSLGIDLCAAVEEKLKRNAEKYPEGVEHF